MAYSVGDPIEMARALSQGEFENQFSQRFQGELGKLVSYLEAVRQTLQPLSVNASDSREFIPQESDIVAEINREAEKNFNLVWQASERIQSDPVTDREILSNSAEELTAATFVGFAISPINSSRSCLTVPATRRKSYCE